MTTPTPVPPAAKWLGALGLLPFLVPALAAPLLAGAWRQLALTALLAYGAVILSFLGGIQWGLAIARPRQAGLAWALGASVVPSLLAWVALLLPPGAGMALLALAIGLVLWVDLVATRHGQAPAWYPALRMPLSAGAILSLLGGILA